MAAGMAGPGHLRVSRADHEHVIDTLKAAFVQGRLTRDELGERAGQTFTARTYAELAAVIADLPVRSAAGQSPSKHSRARARWPVNTSLKAGARAVLVVSVLAALIAAPVAVLAGKTGDSALTGTSPDTQACRTFNAWTAYLLLVAPGCSMLLLPLLSADLTGTCSAIWRPCSTWSGNSEILPHSGLRIFPKPCTGRGRNGFGLSKCRLYDLQLLAHSWQ